MAGYRKGRRLNRNFVLLCVLLVLVGVNIVLLLGRAVEGWLKSDGEDVEVPAWVEQDYLRVNDYSRPGTKLEDIRGVVVHYVGNPGTSAEANRNYFASLASGETLTFASSHFVVGLEGEVIQCIPLTEIAYASNQRNGDTVAIEVCHPDETGEFLPETYDSVVALTAWLCDTFALEPEEDVIRHYDVTGKECPRYYVTNPDAWDAFRADVAAELELLTAEAEK